MNPKFIADRVTKLRMEKNLSEYELSYNLGHSKTYINQLTNGSFLPSIPELLNICEYFEISPSEFFKGYDDEDVFGDNADEFIRRIKNLSDDDRLLIMRMIDRFSSKK